MKPIYPNQKSTPGSSPESYKFICSPTQTASGHFLCLDSIGHYFVYEQQFIVNRTFCYSPYMLMYVRQGCMALQIQDNDTIHDYEVGAHQAFLIKTSSPHTYRCIRDAECFWLHFGGFGAEQLFMYLLQQNQGSHVFFLHESAGYQLLFRALLDNFMNSKLPIPEIVLSARLHELLAFLQVYSQSANHKPIDEVLHYINQHYAEDISLQQLASHTNMSPSHFSATFKKRMQISPYQYVIATRLHAACQHLSSNSLSVEEIAYQVGFKSSNAFIEAFRQRYHTTPHQYRKMLL